MKKITIFTFIFFLLSFIFCKATVRYVSHTGTDTPPYTSWETAADSIMSAINISSFGDTIYVANGVYEEKVVMIPGLSLIGAGMDSCIIDMVALSPSQPTAITMKDSCLLSGFQLLFDSATPYSGTGVYVQDSSKGCVINNNAILYADNGIWVTEGNIINNTILKSTFGIIGVVNDFSRQYIAHIDSNYISFFYKGIRALDNTIFEAKDNLFKAEDINGEAYVLSVDLLSNSTFNVFSNNNIAKSAYDIIYNRAILNAYPGDFTNNQFLIKYSTLFYNSSPSASFKNNNVINSVNASNGTGIIRYNNFWKVSSYPQDTTNISANPMFVNEDSMDYHLQAYSPLIDAGDPDILDKDGSRSDIGLYGGPYGESYGYPDLPPAIPVNFSGVLDTNYILLSWNKNTEADFRYYNLYRDTVQNFTVDSTKLISSQVDTFFIQSAPFNADRYVYKVSGVDKQGNQSDPSAEVVINITGVKEYPQISTDYRLYQNYPNPFNPSTKIGYRLKKRGYVKLYIYDLTGSIVATLVNEEKAAGYYEVVFNAGDKLSSGIYLYRISITDSEKRIPEYSNMGKMMLVK